MKQYCRYCAYCVYGDVVWCDELNKELAESTAKSLNHCKHFVFNPIDALSGILTKEYKPREKKIKPKQFSLFE